MWYVRPVIVYFGDEAFICSYSRGVPRSEPLIAMVHSYIDGSFMASNH